jgi:hypothetical protein
MRFSAALKSDDSHPNMQRAKKNKRGEEKLIQ